MKSGLLVLLFFAVQVHAGEADYFTNRYPVASGKTLSHRDNPTSALYKLDELASLRMKLKGVVVDDMESLPDSLKPMNDKMNRELDLAAASTGSCNESSFHETILKRMGGFLVAEIERWLYTEKFNSYGPLNLNNQFGTVYSDNGVRGCCANIQKINGVLVSADKLGHFISHGYEYFEISQRKTNSPLESIKTQMNKTSIPFAVGLKGTEGALELGHRQEAGAWGLSSSGVYSYGDIAANYDGMKFWLQLTQGKNPYFRCQNGAWKRVREFDWADYVSDAWDEAINCNHYGSEAVGASVAKRVKEIQTASGKSVLTCPVEPPKCQALAIRYKDVATRVLSPECRAAGRSASPNIGAPSRPRETVR